MLSFEFCEISKNAFFTEHLWETASAVSNSTLESAITCTQNLEEAFLQNATSGLLFGVKAAVVL